CHLDHNFGYPVLLRHCSGNGLVLAEPFGEKDVEDCNDEEQCERQEALDIGVELKTKQAKITENTEKKADHEEREKNKPQITPDKRQNKDCRKSNVKIIPGNPQEIQSRGDEKEVQYTDERPGSPGQELRARDQHQGDIAGGKSERKTEDDGKL